MNILHKLGSGDKISVDEGCDSCYRKGEKGGGGKKKTLFGEVAVKKRRKVRRRRGGRSVFVTSPNWTINFTWRKETVSVLLLFLPADERGGEHITCHLTFMKRRMLAKH